MDDKFVSLNEVLKVILDWLSDDKLWKNPKDLSDNICALSPVDVKPVIKGEWVRKAIMGVGGVWVTWCCNKCGYVRTQGWTSTKDGEKPKAIYCEACGADMRKEKKDE